MRIQRALGIALILLGVAMTAYVIMRHQMNEMLSVTFGLVVIYVFKRIERTEDKVAELSEQLNRIERLTIEMYTNNKSK